MLEIESDNRHAREKIYEMAKIYRKWGDNAYQQANNQKARTYYQRYLLIAEYLITDFGDAQIQSEIEEIKNNLTYLILTIVR